MRVFIPGYDPNKIGGGWTATRYICEGLGNSAYEDADIYLITGATMASHDEVDQAKRDGKKIVIRVDNHLLPSRNRNTGMSRMKSFAEKADLVIFQSKWARDYLSPILGVEGEVILNGTDLTQFQPAEKVYDVTYARSSRIAEKGWEMARYWFSRNHENRKLEIVGKFSGENTEYSFDLFNGERIRFWGELSPSEFSMILRGSKQFLYSYFMDACSNTLIEARASGCEIVDVYGMLQTGGAPEIMACDDLSKERMIKEYQECLRAIV